VTDELEGMWNEGLEIISRHLPIGVIENHEKFYTGYLISRPRIEPDTSKI
jgi:hypothetical protein